MGDARKENLESLVNPLLTYQPLESLVYTVQPRREVYKEDFFMTQIYMEHIDFKHPFCIITHQHSNDHNLCIPQTSQRTDKEPLIQKLIYHSLLTAFSIMSRLTALIKQ